MTQSNIDQIGSIGRRKSGLAEFVKAMGRAWGANWLYSPPGSASQKQGAPVQSQIFGLPSPTGAPIQDLDPSSPTFGEWIDMDDYDAIPRVVLA